jgi:hypothetical protein
LSRRGERLGVDFSDFLRITDAQIPPLSTRSYKRLSGSFLKNKRSSSLTDARLHASPYFFAPEPVVQPKPKMRTGKLRPTSIKTKFAGVDLEAQPESARLTSAKFAAFAPLPPASVSATSLTTRPPSPPPSLAVFAPLSPLKVSFMTERATVPANIPEPATTETLAKKARRVSSNVRRERLGWGRRKASVDHASDLAAVKSKRSSLQIQCVRANPPPPSALHRAETDSSPLAGATLPLSTPSCARRASITRRTSSAAPALPSTRLRRPAAIPRRR